MAKVNPDVLRSTLQKHSGHTDIDTESKDHFASANTDTKEEFSPRRKETQLLGLQRQRVEMLEGLLKDPEKTMAVLRETCTEQAKVIDAFEQDVIQLTREKKVQDVKIEELLVKEALCQQKSKSYDAQLDKHKRELERLRDQSRRVISSKRKLADYLDEIGFTKNDLSSKTEASKSQSSDATWFAYRTTGEPSATKKNATEPVFGQCWSGPPEVVIAETFKTKDTRSSTKKEGCLEAEALVTKEVERRELIEPATIDIIVQPRETPKELATDYIQSDRITESNHEDPAGDASSSESEGDIGSEYDPEDEWDVQTDV